MLIVNTTRISTDLLSEIVSFCRPHGVSLAKLLIRFRNSDGVSGRAYVDDCEIIIRLPRCYTGAPQPYRRRRLLRYVVDNPGKIPLDLKSKRNPRRTLGRIRQATGEGYVEDECFTRRERIVGIVAHELRHLWQKKFRYAPRYWGSHGRYSERDAESYAMHRVREWRREKIYDTEAARLSAKSNR